MNKYACNEELTDKNFVIQEMKPAQCQDFHRIIAKLDALDSPCFKE